MKTIVYTCPYVPAEWIAAHGLRPSRVVPGGADSALSPAAREGVCPYVRGFIAEVTTDARAGAVVMTTVCDQMRRAFDIISRKCEVPAFLMNVPNTWQTTAAQQLYTNELKRLGRFFVRQGGKAPSNHALAAIMLGYDITRKSLLAQRENLSARQYAEKIAEFGRSGRYTSGAQRKTQYARRNTRLAIIGGPLMKQEFRIFDIIEQCGGRVVLDATETGERGMCAPLNAAGLREDPLSKLADAYFGGIVDASRRPDSELYEWFERELAERDVQGVIFRRYVWCDMWHAQLMRLKDLIDLPVLDIDTAGDLESEENRTAGRIRAFLEMLQ
ncbi:MAG: 2-hydroxyacyl-CoA dehydratase [Planctomycetota bacterium]|jgi:benzoyl-CoA reductase/2-hydroxyglutaryl-CoA dehydratase subunit BcrC/BadD/HgdB